jgi:putative tryptophan/tyrosine transport system permease protein
MLDLLKLLDNASVQGLSYGIAAVGLSIAFRIVRYPDLTADGSFLLGASIFACTLSVGAAWGTALATSACAGCLAGAFTMSLYHQLGIPKLLTGILTSMISYSLAFRIMGGRPNVGLQDAVTMFSGVHLTLQEWDLSEVIVSGAFTAMLYVIVLLMFRSELGLLLRAAGQNPNVVDELGRSHRFYQTIGLLVANGLVAVSGALIAARQGFVDVNMGFGTVITLVAAMVLGEVAIRRFSKYPHMSLARRLVAPIFGAFLYFILYLIVLRASVRGWLDVMIMPTDLKMLSALVVILLIGLRRVKPEQEELLPI